MKLLLDQNLSFRLLEKLEPVYRGSTQVKFVELDQADDLTIWQFAKDNGFTIVTKDSDFHEFNLAHLNPPKIIWLKCGSKPKWYVLGLFSAVSNSAFIELPARHYPHPVTAGV